MCCDTSITVCISFVSPVEKIPLACGAVESFLEMNPTDASMLKNKQFYLSEYQKMDKYFKPRKASISFFG